MHWKKGDVAEFVTMPNRDAAYNEQFPSVPAVLLLEGTGDPPYGGQALWVISVEYALESSYIKRRKRFAAYLLELKPIK